jgi:hypothetical protein
VGDVDIFGDQERYFDVTPIGESGSPYARPAIGTFGNIGRNELRGPGYWRTDASLFKEFAVTEGARVQFRAEVFNLFNNVNLGQPDAEIGLSTNLNTNAGRITQTAYGGTDPMRSVQFALKVIF